MTMTAFPSLLAVPELQSLHSGSYAAGTLASTTAKVAEIFECPEDGPLTDVMIRTWTVTSAADISVRFETVNPVNGLPTGTLIGAGADAVVSSPVAQTVYFPTLTTPQTVTKGQRIALVVSCPSGTPNLNIARMTPGQTFGLPYSATAATGAYSQTASVHFPLALKINGSWVVPFGLIGAPNISAISTTPTSTPNERGNRFSFPYAVRIAGLWVSASIDAATVTADAFLRDLSDAVLASTTYVNAVSNGNPAFLLFPTPYDLAANTEARATLKTTAGSKNNRGTDVTSSTYISTLPGKGLWKRTSRKDSGAWTDVDTGVDAMGVLVSHVDLGGGGGAPTKRWAMVDGELVAA